MAVTGGLEPSGGTFGTYLSRVRTAGLLEVQESVVRPSKTLFP